MTLILGKTLNLDFSSWLRETKVSLEPTESQVPSALNDPLAKVTQWEEGAVLNPFKACIYGRISG